MRKPLSFVALSANDTLTCVCDEPAALKPVGEQGIVTASFVLLGFDSPAGLYAFTKNVADVLHGRPVQL